MAQWFQYLYLCVYPKEWEQKCPEFSQLRRRQEELPELGGLKLNALLITPVQRIPRYCDIFLCPPCLRASDKNFVKYTIMYMRLMFNIKHSMWYI